MLPDAENLVQVIRLKILARRLGVPSITVTRGELVGLGNALVVGGLIYGLVNVRTDGTRILWVTLDEGPPKWQIKTFQLRFRDPAGVIDPWFAAGPDWASRADRQRLAATTTSWSPKRIGSTISMPTRSWRPTMSSRS